MADAKRSRSEGMETFAVLIRGRAFCFDLWMRFGRNRIVLATREWSVLQSALWKDLVFSTRFKCDFLVMIRSSWCQCLDRGCLHEALWQDFVAKNVFVTHR